ncbi:hypothetical protein WN944_011892 [Citrus x changshan-huyou]|uniref:GIR1-like zinc ribbon domain-containing protein n=3 Tax=Citrus TaxID=2706 RepID=A0A067GQB2_CITSI|nr:uncharacterized protein LOC102611537 [Citrus sinensis]KAH9747528.1 Filamentous hemagglutinin transporter [Citrus sinensis]KDO77516.1 hypothetical protein CISIN_1g027262mg [Citrus sinensis]
MNQSASFIYLFVEAARLYIHPFRLLRPLYKSYHLFIAFRFWSREMTSEILITKDFLGGLSNNTESDLNSKTEHASHERCSSPNSPLSSSLSSDHQTQTNPAADFEALNLNYPPPSSSSSSAAAQMNLFEEACLDLKLQSSSSSSSHNYQSVCTLDKVKSALQRAEKETEKKRQSPSSSSAMFAAACPGCLLYVITLKTNPKCPRCNSTVPSPLVVKKARIDLNASF